jgi:hypothetical protein
MALPEGATGGVCDSFLCRPVVASLTPFGPCRNRGESFSRQPHHSLPFPGKVTSLFMSRRRLGHDSNKRVKVEHVNRMHKNSRILPFRQSRR